MLLAIDFTNLHEILQALYQDMMPLCEKLTGVAKGCLLYTSPSPRD